MCGRYYIALDAENARVRAMLAELNRRALPMAGEVRLGEVFPSQIAMVILREEGAGVTVRPMRWGFPRAGGGGLVINSRSEKAEITPMFQRAARERRCLIPADGFYEWRRTPSGAKTKEKFAFSLRDAETDELMYMAGFYGRFLGGFEEGGFDGFAVLTQPADPQVSPYHDRMPVILRGDALRKAWLDPSVPYESLRAAFSAPALDTRPETGTAGDAFWCAFGKRS